MASQMPLYPQAHFQPFGYCDSYFVEGNDDDGIYARAATERERARGLAKLRQKALAEELSRATTGEYHSDILAHMEHMEGETMPDIQSIEIQTEIQWFMRPYLLDFLLEAHHAFQLLPETLHLAVNLLDRYCSRRVVYKRHYQLVGCASLLIAAKYGDRKERVPTIRELKSMCCSLYDDDMFTQMEWHVLSTLNWTIGHPTVTSFLQVALMDTPFDPALEHLTWYILELGLYHKEFISVRPSIMARSALALARAILGRNQPCWSEWPARYDAQVVLSLSNHLNHPSQALHRKHASPHLSTVSVVVERFLQQQLAMNRAAAHTPVNDPATVGDQLHAPNAHYLGPQTPQKAAYATGPAGVLTPPITPDKDCYAPQQTFSNAHTAVPRGAHFVPTPPPSAEQSQHVQQMDYMSQYVQQPQFIQ
ncbi:hypothetical protein K431DRAFT_161653 [Polychaeton citri CBS 116435]|uniref:Cyclin N-terminal domain-containing protein n=1 Tax=Polychaeton citri CBS 116435 TaxID=1314669 RepID=A0A9P4UK60_9PEZI|nr:hypothetical protein K431DRAFT_161653 [Polychaeton citri CBS 116435]